MLLHTNSNYVLQNLSEYLIMYLDELTGTAPQSEFNEGQILAFVECLEMVSKWKKFRKFGIVNIEERFPIK